MEASDRTVPESGDAPGSNRTLMIVFIAAGVLLTGGVIALFAFVLFTPRVITPSSFTVTTVDERIPVKVDTRLRPVDAWRVSGPEEEPTRDRPSILAAKWGPDVVQLLVFQPDDTGADEVDMYIPLGRNLSPAEVVVKRKFPSTQPPVTATSVGGSISVDADALPSASTDRIVRYDITAQRDGHEHRFTGKILVTADNLHDVLAPK